MKLLELPTHRRDNESLHSIRVAKQPCRSCPQQGVYGNLENSNGPKSKIQVIRWPRDRSYRECGYTQCSHVTKGRSGKDGKVKNFNEQVPTTKVADVASYKRQTQYSDFVFYRPARCPFNCVFWTIILFES